MNTDDKQKEVSLTILKQCFEELYVYTFLVRNAQIEYFKNHSPSILFAAKMYEKRLDVKLKSLINLIEYSDQNYKNDILKRLKTLQSYVAVKNDELFK